VKGETQELLIQLCEQAALEQDPKRLLELMTRINALLEQKKRRLKAQQSSPNLKFGCTRINVIGCEPQPTVLDSVGD
jgi:hypothetical protein